MFTTDDDSALHYFKNRPNHLRPSPQTTTFYPRPVTDSKNPLLVLKFTKPVRHTIRNFRVRKPLYELVRKTEVTLSVLPRCRSEKFHPYSCHQRFCCGFSSRLQ